jgi:hypothetical protein
MRTGLRVEIVDVKSVAFGVARGAFGARRQRADDPRASILYQGGGSSAEVLEKGFPTQRCEGLICAAPVEAWPRRRIVSPCKELCVRRPSCSALME